MANKFRDWVIADREVIDNACRSDSRRCVIADGIRKSYPRVTNVLVDEATIRFTDRDAGERYIFLMTNDLREILRKFDHGETIEPFKFRLPSRAFQAMQITCRENRPNKKDRPRNPGRAHSTEKAANYVPTIKGGKAPAVSSLAHGPAGSKRKAWVRENGYRSNGHWTSSLRPLDGAE